MATSTPTFLASTIGRKIVMATTGVILFGFVVAHMAGNLQLYLGPSVMNEYAVFLREFLHGAGLWIARGVLLAAVALHVWAAVSLTRTDLDARPVEYRELRPARSTYASRSMRWTGLFVAVFVVYHLLDLTFGTVNPGFVHGDVHGNVVRSFRVVPVGVFYLVAMVLVGLHLKHGTISMLRTLGVSHPRHLQIAGQALTVILAVTIAANMSFPLSVLFGVVR
jgi:succinate dehydrogenase / fumarate reductase, cytochrome b subunit